MSTLIERSRKYVSCLVQLEESQDLRALADLRRGLRRGPGEAHEMDPHVVQFLDEGEHPSDRWFYVVGALFAWHPHHRRGGSLGHAFREIRSKSGSIEARFATLLNSDSRDLPVHLRQAIGLLRSSQAPVPVDWWRLLVDLTRWDHPDHRVQRKWARAFYRPDGSIPTTPNGGEK